MNRGIEGVIVDDLTGPLKGARHVLYVTDNAGEIGFDSLVIRQIKEMGLKVTLVVKNDTFFEDATMSDALSFHLDELVDEIVTVPGFMAPHEVEPPLKEVLALTDLVIAKGTGSYEALHGELGEKKVAYLLKIKCKPIARELGMNEGGVIVKLQ
jgi:hypothetical protein